MENELLIKKAARGDTDAFAEIIRMHQPRIYGLALRMLKNADDAADAAEEAIVRIWRALPRFKGRAEFSTWAYTITRNTCLDFIKKQPKTVDIEELPAAASDDADPAEQAERSERIRIVRRAIEALPDRLRDVIIMRDIEGYSYAEIARLTDTEEGTVKSRINRARSRLKALLEDMGIF